MPQTEANQPLLDAITRILRPLVRMLVRAGINWDDFAEVGKRVFVETVVRDSGSGPELKSIPRIALTTGLPQREVEGILESAAGSGPRGPNIAVLLAEIVQQWHTNPAFNGPYGVPLDLDFDETPARSFTALARRVTRDIAPRRLLDELIGGGAVVPAGPDHYKIVTRTFVFPSTMTPGMYEYFGTIMTDLAATVEFNMRDDVADKRLERSVFTDRPLTEAQITAFQAFARTRVPGLIGELDNWLSRAASEAPAEGDEPLYDTGINVFQFVRERMPDRPIEALYQPRPPLG
jgi:hypothetical protein